jgi:hypothetical protein
MSTDPSPLAVSARFGAPTRTDGGPGDARAPEPAGPPATALVPAAGPPDPSAWSRWWRDLIVERYRVDRFDAFVPLPDADCTWEQRVALGRLVEHAMADVQGPSMTTQLVIDALDAAGFGRVRDLVPDDRRTALVRAGWWADPWPADDSLRLGVLGSVADALLQVVPETPAELDLRAGADGAAPEGDPFPVVQETVLRATRSAVLAYARHVEALAVRSRLAARSLQF